MFSGPNLLEKRLYYGGEGNGGVIVPEINPCRDSIVAMGLVLELLALSDKTLSNIASELPTYVMKKMSLNIENRDKGELYSEIQKRAKQLFAYYRINNIDGIKIYNNEEWLHLRLSNTEPVLRIMAESKTEAKTKALLHKGISIIKTDP